MVNIHVRLRAEAALQHCSTGGAEGAQGVPRNAPRREVGAGGCEDGGVGGRWILAGEKGRSSRMVFCGEVSTSYLKSLKSWLKNPT